MQDFAIVQTVSCGNKSITTKYATVEDYNEVNGAEVVGDVKIVTSPKEFTRPWEEFQDIVTILKNLYNNANYAFYSYAGSVTYLERIFQLYKEILKEDIVVDHTTQFDIYVSSKGECDQRRFLAVMSAFRTIGTQIIFTEDKGE